MLARNAESLYWIGRSVERADDTARILDVSVHQLLEDATVDTDRVAGADGAVGGVGADVGAAQGTVDEVGALGLLGADGADAARRGRRGIHRSTPAQARGRFAGCLYTNTYPDPSHPPPK